MASRLLNLQMMSFRISITNAGESVWPELTELYGEDAVELVKNLKAEAK